MDFITGLPKSEGKSVIMVVGDRLTKYAHFCALSHPFNASTVATAFMETIQKLHGTPKIIVSDRDPIFTGNFWTEFVGNLVILIDIDVNKAFYKTGNEIVRSQIKSSGDWLNIDNEYHNDLSIMMVVDSFFILQYLFGHDRRAHSIQITADREFL